MHLYLKTTKLCCDNSGCFQCRWNDWSLCFQQAITWDNHHQAPVYREVLILNSAVLRKSNKKQANYTPSPVWWLKLCISNEMKGFNKAGILGERLSDSLQLYFESTVDFKGQVIENTKWWKMLLHFSPVLIYMMYPYIYFLVSSFNMALQWQSLYILILSIVLQWHRVTRCNYQLHHHNGSSE